LDFLLSYRLADAARSILRFAKGNGMTRDNRLLSERDLDPRERKDARGAARVAVRPARSVTVNLAESPLGWLLARGHLDRRQFDAGERLRFDYERGQLSQRVTMAWDAAPVARGRGGSSGAPDLGGRQIDARRRFDHAIAAAGPGLADILWRTVCGGEGMRDAETALGWPARAGKLVLTIALNRVADYYRIR
jgi:hypothetical protein